MLVAGYNMGLYFFCALSDSTSSKTGKFDFGPQGGREQNVWGVVSSSHGDPEQEDAGSHQAGRSRQWWWGGETPKHWQGAASCCDWCSRVSQLFLRGSVICVFLFKYQVLCLNVFHVLWLTLALYFLHVSLQSNKFVLESITVIYIQYSYIHAIHVCIFYVYNLVADSDKKWLFRLGLKCFHRGIRTWGHSWLSFCGADLDRGKSFAPCRHHLRPQSLQLLQGSWSVVFLPLTSLFKPFCWIFCWFNMTLKLEATHSGICQLQASCMTLWRKLCWKGLHCSFLEDHYCFDDIR